MGSGASSPQGVPLERANGDHAAVPDRKATGQISAAQRLRSRGFGAVAVAAALRRAPEDTTPLRLIGTRKETDNGLYVTLQFEMTASAKPYRPGQYVVLHFTLPGQGPVSRRFTVREPRQGGGPDQFDITVKRTGRGGAADFLCDLSRPSVAGGRKWFASLLLQGAHASLFTGSFCWRSLAGHHEFNRRKVAFFAAGAGMASVYALLAQAFDGVHSAEDDLSDPLDICLFYSERASGDLAFQQDLDRWQRRSGRRGCPHRLQVYRFLTRASPSEGTAAEVEAQEVVRPAGAPEKLSGARSVEASCDDCCLEDVEVVESFDGSVEVMSSSPSPASAELAATLVLPAVTYARIDLTEILRCKPDLARHLIVACGPTSFMGEIRSGLKTSCLPNQMVQEQYR